MHDVRLQNIQEDSFLSRPQCLLTTNKEGKKTAAESKRDF